MNDSVLRKSLFYAELTGRKPYMRRCQIKSQQWLTIFTVLWLLVSSLSQVVHAEKAALPENNKVIKIASADSRPPYILQEERSGLELDISDINDLGKYSVVAFLNANNVLGDAFHTMTEKNLSYLEVSPQQKQNKMLYLKRVDVVIADKYVFQYLNTLITREVDVSENLHYHMIFPASEYFASFHDEKLKNTFNLGLKNIRRNGVYQQLVQKYVGTAQ